jgi:2-succinyl-6-hydroxy-2,4-cyclohexadiene-1-carboxylate synthase
VPGQRIVALHGFSQTARCWGPLAARLRGAGFDFSTPDLPGHGDAPEPAADMSTTAAIMAHIGGRATYLGYSFGGRVALRLAVDHPHIVERLVLISATAGIENDTERRERRAADDRLADVVEREGVATFIDEWVQLPLFAGVPERYRFRDERLRNSAAGLAASLRLAGSGAQEPIWHRLPEITMPVLVITGSLDTKFEQLGDRLAACIGPHAERLSITDAGHTAHLEQPEALSRQLLQWLERAEGVTPAEVTPTHERSERAER